MNAIKRYWIDFSAWVKGRNRLTPLGSGYAGHFLFGRWDKPQTFQPIPVESWADSKLAYVRARKAHRDQRQTHAQFRKATNRALIQQIFADEAKCLRLIDTHPWLIRDPDAFSAMVKATARRRIAETGR